METENERLREVLSRLEKRSRSHMHFADEVEVERLETPSIGLTQALSGGWAMGRMGLIWGAKAAGKSTFLLQQVAIAQERGLVCAYMDSEKGFDKVWAQKNGVNLQDLIHTETGTVTDMVNDGADLMRAGVDLLVVDSLSFMMPSTFVDENGDLKDFQKTGAIGGMARSLSPALSQMMYANKNDTLILFVSQVRMQQKGSMYWGSAPMGGKAVDHAMSQSVKLHASEGKDALIKGEVVAGDRIFEKPVGRKVTWTVDKDRIGPGLGTTGEYTLYFDGDFIGVDSYAEILNIAVEHGIIKKAGAWFSYDNDNIGQGELKTAARLREDKELFTKVKGELDVRV